MPFFCVSRYQASHFDCACHHVSCFVSLVPYCINVSLLIITYVRTINYHVSAMIKYMLSHYMINYRTYACLLTCVWLSLEVKAVGLCFMLQFRCYTRQTLIFRCPFSHASEVKDFGMEAVLFIPLIFSKLQHWHQHAKTPSSHQRNVCNSVALYHYAIHYGIGVDD